MNLREKRAATYAQAQKIVTDAKAANVELTADQAKEVQGLVDQVKGFDKDIAEALKSEALIGAIDALGAAPEGDSPTDDSDDQPAKSLGNHFVKHAGPRLKSLQGVNGASITVPEFRRKAAADAQSTGAAGYAGVLTQVDRTIVQAYRPGPVIADLLGKGAIADGNNSISYFVEKAREGNFAAVAEGGTKPQLHYVDPEPVTDKLRKIAGFIQFTDEMLTDLDFVVSEIDQRLLYDLAMQEEFQLLSGTGVGANVLGLLNRSGIQTELRGNAASGDTIADTIFRAITKVQTATGLTADGVVVNPLDYQALRLTKDANDQYYGGGYFSGQYGNGAVPGSPSIWGLPTVVSPAVVAGTALVANFSQAATLYRQGGVQVDSTTSHGDNFVNGVVTLRAKERVALAVRKPLAFVKVTTTPAA
ncbi:phage major capsid protein [Rhodococcus globerulus]|uniref:Phage major capsid protein n=1 Tax=Rhodococcus globerulus TaxID=33008 RepID=A0ABU4BSK5_RHOGO|nr:phage major capsid protein [Rhodococcus globerulus]MDV6267069.1 phage major capsid protein [Rhodococcus globerulus]